MDVGTRRYELAIAYAVPPIILVLCFIYANDVVEPDKNGPYPDGLHTLSAFGDMTLVDGKREQFIWPAVVRSARNLWRGASKLEDPQISAVLPANHDVVEHV